MQVSRGQQDVLITRLEALDRTEATKQINTGQAHEKGDVYFDISVKKMRQMLAACGFVGALKASEEHRRLVALLHSYDDEIADLSDRIRVIPLQIEDRAIQREMDIQAPGAEKEEEEDVRKAREKSLFSQDILCYRAKSLVPPMSASRQQEMDECGTKLTLSPLEQQVPLLVRKAIFLVTGVWSGPQRLKPIPPMLLQAIESITPQEAVQVFLDMLDEDVKILANNPESEFEDYMSAGLTSDTNFVGDLRPALYGLWMKMDCQTSSGYGGSALSINGRHARVACQHLNENYREKHMNNLYRKFNAADVVTAQILADPSNVVAKPLGVFRGLLCAYLIHAILGLFPAHQFYRFPAEMEMMS